MCVSVYTRVFFDQVSVLVSVSVRVVLNQCVNLFTRKRYAMYLPRWHRKSDSLGYAECQGQDTQYA